MAEPSALTLSEQIRVSLEADILSGALTPGQRLDEQEIAVRFNASRTPVREALRGLEARSMIIWEARRGPTVRVLSLGEVIDMFQVMAEMEGLCARLAARRATAEDVAELEALHAVCVEWATKSDYDRFYEANKNWHEKIYQVGRNRFLQVQTEDLRMRVAPYRRFITQQPGRMSASIGEHAAVLEAIRDRRDEDAHVKMRDHVSILGYEVTDWMHWLGTAKDETDRRSGPEIVRSKGSDNLGQ
ncbi:MAG: gntR [Devosia sp.]|uniref:GntR family transcriptional regulator n=1 Tax=Devosia sp. TaxID=1871048 RepID=UPI002633DDFB|nr:GntR family transcriptional regulator [Devosia sp.]MDB5527145.1 gntR [Devosia sp.]